MPEKLISFSMATLSVIAAAVHCPSLPTDDLMASAANSPSSGPACICEFYAAGVADDEYFAIRSNSESDICMDGWSVSDGEGSVVFAPGSLLRAHATATVSFNSTSFTNAFGRPPDFAVDGAVPTTQACVIGSFRLADDGDDIALLDGNGVEIDTVVYGAASTIPTAWLGDPVPRPSKGVVMRRIDGSQDTDSAADWRHFREYKYGYSEHPDAFSTVPPGDLTAFVSPDCSLRVVRDWIASSERAIRLCAYELDSLGVCRDLMDAIQRRVDVRILLDGSPVGGVSSAEMVALSALASAGADVRMVAGDLRAGVVKHIAAMHSKYMVVDDDGLIVLSENFVGDGLPTDEVFGNRGWGVAMRCRELAQHAAAVFDDDRRSDRPDVFDWVDDGRFDAHAELPEEPRSSSTEGMVASFVSDRESEVGLYVSPDCSKASPFLCEMIGSARDVLVQQFQADLLWSSAWSGDERLNPLLDSTLGSLRAGGSCRMLLDSSWFNREDNGDVVSAMAAAATAESLDGSFKLISERSPITVMHNKGLVLDGHTTVVSSNNWVFSSFAENRELAAVVRSAEVASYFADVFALDWYPDVACPVLSERVELTATCGERVRLSSGCFVDDRLVARCSWDVGMDGTLDGTSDALELLVTVPGVIDVGLTVVDAWGNEANTVMVIRVVAVPTPVEDEPSAASSAGIAATSVLIVVWYMAVIRRRRRGQDGRRTRKVKDHLRVCSGR